jgi:hypothetical protein
MSGADLLADEIPDFGGSFVGHRAGDHRRASRGKFVEHREIKVAVKSERQRAGMGVAVITRTSGSGDGSLRSGAHGASDPGRGRPHTSTSLLHQLQPLHYAEAVLLVHHDQP